MPLRKITLTLCILAAVAVAGCSGKSSSGGGKKPTPTHWAKRPTETVTGKHNGIAFSIVVPKGMRKKTDKTFGVELDMLFNDRVKLPSISVRATDKLGTLKDYVKGEPKTEFIRKKQLPDGFITTAKNSAYKNRQDYIVYLERKAGSKALICHARVSHWTRGDNVKQHLPTLEKICLSLKAK